VGGRVVLSTNKPTKAVKFDEVAKNEVKVISSKMDPQQREAGHSPHTYINTDLGYKNQDCLLPPVWPLSRPSSRWQMWQRHRQLPLQLPAPGPPSTAH